MHAPWVEPSAHQFPAPAAESVEAREGRKDVERLAAFSDAIFGFSMTVLAVEIKVPTVTGDVATALARAMRDQLPHLLSFVFAFLVVALLWTSHHRIFRHIRRVDGGLIWLNILLLMLIAFMPVAEGYLGEYGDVPLIAALYAGILMTISLLTLLVWRHAAAGGLLERNLNPRLVRHFQWRVLVPALVFGTSIPIAFTLGASVAEYSWLLIVPIRAWIDRGYSDVSAQIYGDA